jgi:hypothetical protein
MDLNKLTVVADAPELGGEIHLTGKTIGRKYPRLRTHQKAITQQC